jgi:hypothetical protein
MKISCNTRKSPEDFASRIVELHKYLGALAFVEIQLGDPEQVIKGRERLLQIIEKYPKYPHAFYRLWLFDFSSSNYEHSVVPIEQLNNRFNEFHNIPEMETFIALLYSKSLFKSK